jgi:putative autoinducer-2 (AI-2) aldolase
MEWGMVNRMSKLILEDQHCFYLAMDHGYLMGATHGLDNVGESFQPVEEFVDAVFVARGSLRATINPKTKVPIILRVSGGSSIFGDDLSNEEQSVSIEDIIRLNVQAVGFSVYFKSSYEHQTLMGLYRLVNECMTYSSPVMAVTAVGREMEEKKQDVRFLRNACRMCAEAGAVVVKTYYHRDFDQIVSGCPVPVVIAGGPKTENDLEVLEFVYDGMQKGAAGVNLGRNIWQNTNPRGMAAALKAVIHEKATPKEAYDVYLAVEMDHLTVG